MLLVAFEPEEEAGAIFLRLRKAVRKKGLPVATLAPYLSNGDQKLDATLIATAPGAEASALAELPTDDSSRVRAPSSWSGSAPPWPPAP